MPNRDGRRRRYDKNLDRPDIRPGVERILKNIKSLLDEAGKVDERYGLSSKVSEGSEVSTSRGLEIFKGSFERLKARIKKQKRERHRLGKLQNGLYTMRTSSRECWTGSKILWTDWRATKSLGLLQEQHDRLQQEIESISDTQSLRLLRDASSRHGSLQQEVSDAASQRRISVAASITETQTLDLSSCLSSTGDSFITAWMIYMFLLSSEFT